MTYIATTLSSAAVQAAVPELQAVEMEHHTAREIYKDPAAAARRSKKMREIYKKHACHPWRLGANMVTPCPCICRDIRVQSLVFR
jgi:membrane protein insertase Oxa1/YidC/SpoIIIJ